MPDVADDCTLEAHGIHVRFGGVMAVNGVDIALRSREILGLIGPNGAGKTTLVNVLSGFQEPTEGDIWLNRENVTTWTPRRRAANGLARTFQDIRLFTDLTVFENVEAGALGVGGQCHLEAGAAQPESDQVANRLLVLDHQDPGLRHTQPSVVFRRYPGTLPQRAAAAQGADATAYREYAERRQRRAATARGGPTGALLPVRAGVAPCRRGPATPSAVRLRAHRRAGSGRQDTCGTRH